LRQTIFRVYPEKVLKILALPALLFYLAFFLFSFTVLALSRLVSRTFFRINDIPGREDFFHRFTIPEFYSPFSIKNAVNEGSDDEEPEVKIFHNALEFSKLKVRDCMVPRNEIEGLEVSSNLFAINLLDPDIQKSLFTKTQSIILSDTLAQKSFSKTRKA